MKYIIPQERITNYRKEFFRQLIEKGLINSREFKIGILGNNRNIFGDTVFGVNYALSLSNKTFTYRNHKLVFLGSAFRSGREETHIFEFGLKYVPSIVFCLIRRRKFLLWGHGDDYTRTSRRNFFRKHFKRFILLKSDYFLAYTSKCASSLLDMGYPIHKITVLNNSTDTKTLKDLKNNVTESMIERFKKENKINTEVCFLALGSLVSERRLEFLIESLRLLHEEKNNFVLLVIGAGPLGDNLELGQYDFVRKLDHQDQEGIALASKVCLALLNPGRVGLVAVDSFALGLPIITTSYAHHAPEFSYLEDRVNCLISAHQVDQYVKVIQEFLSSKILQTSLSRQCLFESEKFSIETMVENFQIGCERFENSRIE